MRIAIITPILPMRSDVTRGRFIHETVNALSGLATTHVFLTHAQYPQLAFKRKPTPSDVLETNYPVTQITYPAIPGISRFINSHIQAMNMAEPIRKFKPDIIIGYWAYPEGACAVHVAQKLQVPAVIGALGTDINERSGIQGWLTGRALKNADRSIFVSESMSKHAQRHHGLSPSKCVTIVNGVNTQVFHPQERDACRTALGIPADATLIVYVGRLIQAKGLEELFAAVRSMSLTRPALRCVLIGTGDFSEHLTQLVTARKMTGIFQLTGGLPPDQVAKYVNAADVLTLPSWTEGYPNVLVEALACGCPVVATNVGGIPEIVKPDNGIMVIAKDSKSLQTGLENAISKSWDRASISKNMSRTWRDVATETLHAFRKITNKNT